MNEKRRDAAVTEEHRETFMPHPGNEPGPKVQEAGTRTTLPVEWKLITSTNVKLSCLIGTLWIC